MAVTCVYLWLRVWLFLWTWLSSLRILPKKEGWFSLQVDWDCSWAVEQEILKFIELHQLEAGAMPTQACFVALGREDLHLAMSPKRWGRKTAFMHRLNLSPGDSFLTSFLFLLYNNESCYARWCSTHMLAFTPW